MAHVLEHLRHVVTPEHLVVSIAAGVSIATLEAGLGPDRRIVRVMPNTPALVGEGASGYCLGTHTRESDEATVRTCLDSVGRAHRVPESLLDAVTGLSGSGPAFVYVMIEALSDGGVRVGLPRDMATALAAQTVLGAAKMVLETGLHTGRAQGPGDQPRRDDHRRPARAGARRPPRRLDRCRGGRDPALGRARRAGSRRRRRSALT